MPRGSRNRLPLSFVFFPARYFGETLRNAWKVPYHFGGSTGVWLQLVWICTLLLVDLLTLSIASFFGEFCWLTLRCFADTPDPCSTLLHGDSLGPGGPAIMGKSDKSGETKLCLSIMLDYFVGLLSQAPIFNHSFMLLIFISIHLNDLIVATGCTYCKLFRGVSPLKDALFGTSSHSKNSLIASVAWMYSSAKRAYRMAGGFK